MFGQGIIRRACGMVPKTGRFSRSMTTVKLLEPEVKEVKPKLSQFKNPLYHTFLVASSAYIFLHTMWFALEYEEEKKRLEAKSEALEKEIHGLVEEKKMELESKNRSWIPRLWK